MTTADWQIACASKPSDARKNHKKWTERGGQPIACIFGATKKHYELSGKRLTAHSRHHQIEKFKKEAKPGDRVYLFLKGKGLTHSGILKEHPMGIDGAVAHKGISPVEAPGEVSPRGREEGWSIHVEEWVELPEPLEGEKKYKTLYKMRPVAREMQSSVFAQANIMLRESKGSTFEEANIMLREPRVSTFEEANIEIRESYN